MILTMCHLFATQVYREADRRLIRTLCSHKHPVTCLRFSPWSVDENSNNPVILASLSEQICFWSISYVLNNPLDAPQQRRRSSKRFSKGYCCVRATSTGSGGEVAAMAHHFDTIDLTTTRPSNGLGNTGSGTGYWHDKIGPSDKRELLACIKFVGNSAHKLVTLGDFEKFITVDAEGDIYVLSVRKAPQPNKRLQVPNPTKLNGHIS